MPSARAQQIETLCERWIAATTPAPGGPAWDGAKNAPAEQFRLRRNGIEFPELSREELQAACVGLTRVLIAPDTGLSTIIHEDHLYFWAWIAELICGPYSRANRGCRNEVADLLGTCVRAALAHVGRPGAGDRQTRSLVDQWHFHLLRLGDQAHVVLTYLAFPLLESVLKRKCSAFLDAAGNVIAEFTVPTKGGGIKKYGPAERRNKRCSSVGDLLHLTHKNAQTSQLDLAGQIDRFRTHITCLDPSKDPFETVYVWRNSSLHGEGQMRTIGGTILNLAILIALDNLAGTFESLGSGTYLHVQRETRALNLSMRSQFSFYPP